MGVVASRIDGSNDSLQRFGPNVTVGYGHWSTRFDKIGREDVSLIRAHAAAIELPSPLVLIRFDHRSETQLEASLEGLKRQILENWRAELYFDANCSARSIALAQACALADSRLSVTTTSVGSGIVDLYGATSALFLCGGVLLREHALYMFALAAKNRETVLVYSDEDRWGDNDERLAPIFKPAFSPEFFENKNYLGNCVLVGASPDVLKVTVSDFVFKHRDIGSMVDGFIPRVDPRNVIHVPHILFHDTIERRPRGPVKGRRWLDDPLPSVSIIIPTKDRVNLLRPCIESIQKETEYPQGKFEIVVIDNDSQEEETIHFLTTSASSYAIRVVRDPGVFNFSRMNNRAAARCGNDVLVFLNNDTVVIDPLWLRHLVTFATRGDVAAVGGKLLYPDGTVQHGGVVLGIHCSAVHSHVGIPQDDPGFQGLANVTREVAAVTAACMAIRRDLFERLGGFDESLAIAFNDTDLCLRALEAGYRNIYLSDALMIHYESRTRGLDDTPEKVATSRHEAEMTRLRHARFFKCDPYYNPNLSVDRLYELAFPPRRTKLWRDHARRGGKLRILFLSSAHGASDRVSRIIDMQARHLVSAGHEVFVGGPKSDAESAYADCRRVELALPHDAASFAVENDIDCVIAHEWPFFSVARWTGEWPKVICCDHGQLPREIFDDVRERIEVEKRLSFSVADGVIPASAADGSPLTSTQMLEWLGEAINMLCLRSTARVPVGSPWRGSPSETQNAYVADIRKDADRREFYGRLRGLNGSELVDRAYLAILGRYADQSGRSYYIDQLSKGAPRDRIVWEMASSDEAKVRGVCVGDVMAAAGLTYIEDELSPKKRSRLSAVLAKIWPAHA